MSNEAVYDPEKLRKYPHMLPADVALWERFLSRHSDFFVAVEYDVHVGGAVERLPAWSDKFTLEASWLAAKRIDVVGHKPGEIWLIEVKPEPGTAAIGQLVSYEILYRLKFKPSASLLCCLITNYLVPDEKVILETLGFRWFVV